MILVVGFALILLVLWLRARFYRNRYHRVLKALAHGDVAQRASMTFWKVVGTGVLIAAVRLFLDMHAR